MILAYSGILMDIYFLFRIFEDGDFKFFTIGCSFFGFTVFALWLTGLYFLFGSNQGVRVYVFICDYVMIFVFSVKRSGFGIQIENLGVSTFKYTIHMG